MIGSKRIFCFLIHLFLISHILFGQKEYQKIIIDDYYSHMKQKGDSSQSHRFQIEASKGLIVDATKYDFSKIKKLNKGKDLDLIQLVCNSGTFIIKFNPKEPTIIDKSTVQNVSGNNQFDGFEKGDTAIIGIGTVEIVESKASLLTFWVSLIEIK